MSSLPQIFSDPTQTSASVGTCLPPATLPQPLRKFGYILDPKQLFPGDLILINKSSFWSNIIIKAQVSGGYAEEHARWHHVAVYIEDFQICEADFFGGIKVNKLYKYISKYRIRIRRDLTLSNKERSDIVNTALMRINQPYAVFQLLKLWIQSKYGFWMRTPIQNLGNIKSAICSQLYADAYAYASGKLAVEKCVYNVTPADLSLSSKFKDVKVDWLRVL